MFNQSYLEKPLLLKALLNIAQPFPVMTQNLPEPLSTFRIHEADMHLSTDWLSLPGLVLRGRFWELSACSWLRSGGTKGSKGKNAAHGSCF